MAAPTRHETFWFDLIYYSNDNIGKNGPCFWFNAFQRFIAQGDISRHHCMMQKWNKIQKDEMTNFYNRYLELDDSHKKQINFSHLHFKKDVNFEKAHFYQNVNFSNTQFMEYAYFKETSFTGYADFKETTFTERADFEGATFTERADFEGATFMKGADADFSNTQFMGYADFKETTFTGYANFKETTFMRGADFEGATFTFNGDIFKENEKVSSVSVGGAKTSRNQNLGEQKQKDRRSAYFNKARFESDAIFEGVTFTERADFEGATFMKGAYFKETSFTGYADFKETTFTERADFEGATFTERADFEGATFMKGADADFSNTQFMEYAYFKETSFSGYANFKETTFMRGAIFAGATFTFNGDIFKENEKFKGAFVEGAITSRNQDFGEQKQKARRSAYFNKARFESDAIFEGVTFTERADFEGAEFSRVADFSNIKDKTPLDFTKVEFKYQPPKLFGTTLHEETSFMNVTWPKASVETAEDHFKIYERLRIQVQNLGMVESRNIIVRKELECRAVIAVGLDKLWRRAYGIISNHGTSVSRPLLWLLITFVCIITAWGVVYFPYSPNLVSYSTFWDIFGFNFSKVIPFTRMGNYQTDSFKVLIQEAPIFLIFLSSILSITSPILLFLAGLGLRSKFRMSL